jgi:hypothetical protein
MTSITRDELFALFRTDVHPALETALGRPAIIGFAVYENSEGRRKAVPLAGPNPPASVDEGFSLIGAYRKPVPETSTTRTMAALDYLHDHPHVTPYAAAKMYGITRTAVYRALARRAGKTICPCCNQVVREGFVVVGD